MLKLRIALDGYIDPWKLLASTVGTAVAGIRPTSVTTAVIFVGGVRSYNGLRACRLLSVSVNPFVELGASEITRSGRVRSRGERRHAIDLPISFFMKLSNKTVSENLYVSQQTITGTWCDLAIIATIAVPARE